MTTKTTTPKTTTPKTTTPKTTTKAPRKAKATKATVTVEASKAPQTTPKAPRKLTGTQKAELSRLSVIPTVRRDGEDSKSITAGAQVAHYWVGAGRTPSGRKTFDINDPVPSDAR